MNDARGLIRIAFGIVVGYLVLNSIITFMQAGPTFFRTDITIAIFLVVQTFAILGFIVWEFVIRPDKWIARLLAKIEPKPRGTNIDWVVISYRLAAVIAGILLLYSSMPPVVYLIGSYLTEADSHSVRAIPTSSTMDWFSLGASLFRLAFAIWLLCGAPQLVRWHVKQIRKMAAEKHE